jgi:uncharacterized protein (DUF305 family)
MTEVRMLAAQILTAQQDEVDQLARWHDAGREQLSRRLVSPALLAHATAADAEALCPSLGAYTLQGYS